MGNVIRIAVIHSMKMMQVSKDDIAQFINDMIIDPRRKAIKWSRITKQTAHLKVGYSGQHLASLVTGVEGEGTGARGNDLADGSEVKTCSRVDQLDSCNSCKSPVLRTETKCKRCNSTDINRKNDSKWLFTIKNEDDLNTLVNNPNVNRIVLVLDDYPGFAESNFNDIRIQVFEIYPKEERHSRFKELMTNYYHSIYLEHKKLDQNKTPAPKNFWPDQYQFYMCNPILIFKATILNTDSDDPRLVIERWIEPNVNRNEVESIIMPSEIPNMEEFRTIYRKASKEEIEENLLLGATYETFKEYMETGKDIGSIRKLFKGIGENPRRYLELRNTDRIAVSGSKYKRRTTV
jgi:hypothetical protein